VPPDSSEAGQATVEFALVLPLVLALLACIVGVTVLCLDALALNDLARTSARLAAVSADPERTAEEYIASGHTATVAHATTDGTTVTVRVQRRVTLRLPLVGAIRVGIPLAASSTMVIEPPTAVAPAGTSVNP